MRSRYNAGIVFPQKLFWEFLVWVVLINESSIPQFSHRVSEVPKHELYNEYHVYIWKVSAQHEYECDSHDNDINLPFIYHYVDMGFTIPSVPCDLLIIWFMMAWYYIYRDTDKCKI